jgi:hypothetical protein
MGNVVVDVIDDTKIENKYYKIKYLLKNNILSGWG